mgnify:CR=1 FL=1
MAEEKTLDLNKSVYELCSRHPGLAETMAELGFSDILKPGMLATAGRFMTIPKGAAMKRIDIKVIVDKLREKGFVIEGGCGVE